jgi:hypothetical protein
MFAMKKQVIFASCQTIVDFEFSWFKFFSLLEVEVFDIVIK